MHLTRVQLPVPDPAASAAFYVDVLGATTAAGDGPGGLDATAVAVRLGWTTLVLVGDPHADPSTQHLAVTVPGDAGARARDWLRDRVPLLPHEGRTLLEASPGWDAESVYFPAPDGTVLELIARRRRPVRLGDVPFGPAALLGVSEVGLAVPDVPAAAARCEGTLGLRAFDGPPSASFGAVGDDDGLLVLVRTGRTWFPTRDAVAHPAAVQVRLEGVRPGSLDVNGLATVVGAPGPDGPPPVQRINPPGRTDENSG